MYTAEPALCQATCRGKGERGESTAPDSVRCQSDASSSCAAHHSGGAGSAQDEKRVCQTVAISNRGVENGGVMLLTAQQRSVSLYCSCFTMISVEGKSLTGI